MLYPLSYEGKSNLRTRLLHQQRLSKLRSGSNDYTIAMGNTQERMVDPFIRTVLEWGRCLVFSIVEYLLGGLADGYQDGA